MVSPRPSSARTTGLDSVEPAYTASGTLEAMKLHEADVTKPQSPGKLPPSSKVVIASYLCGRTQLHKLHNVMMAVVAVAVVVMIVGSGARGGGLGGPGLDGGGVRGFGGGAGEGP